MIKHNSHEHHERPDIFLFLYLFIYLFVVRSSNDWINLLRHLGEVEGSSDREKCDADEPEEEHARRRICLVEELVEFQARFIRKPLDVLRNCKSSSRSRR